MKIVQILIKVPPVNSEVRILVDLKNIESPDDDAYCKLCCKHIEAWQDDMDWNNLFDWKIGNIWLTVYLYGSAKFIELQN